MPQRDEYRLDSDTGTQYRADCFTPVSQRRPFAARLGHRVMYAAQPRLGHSDGRQVKPQAQMRSHAETARMSDSLSIHHHQLGAHRELVESRQCGGYLTKGEQPGNVGHAGRLAVYYLLDYLQS